MQRIQLAHGDGGSKSLELIENLILKAFGRNHHGLLPDSSVFSIDGIQNLAFTTDSYVVDPIVFPGGDIGKLAVSGTLNDLAVVGAQPLYLSAGLILEEGLDVKLLNRILQSMAVEASKHNVKITTGDTKVVNKGKCDKIYINTTGVGSVQNDYMHLSGGGMIEPGDLILINGYIGDHGIAILSAREELNLETPVLSDAATLFPMIRSLLKGGGVKFMRDVTRGGLASVLNEMVSEKKFGIEIEETELPVRPDVQSVCDLLGFDPIYMANEGKVAVVIEASQKEAALEMMRSHGFLKAAKIGTVVGRHPGEVLLNTIIGGRRKLSLLDSEMLPRIC
jgi:hydrogenase expression/formation protein HypE